MLDFPWAFLYFHRKNIDLKNAKEFQISSCERKALSPVLLLSSTLVSSAWLLLGLTLSDCLKRYLPSADKADKCVWDFGVKQT